MLLSHMLAAYLLIGAVFGLVNYVVMWRAFHHLGRSRELPGDLLERSVCWHVFAWPSLVFWCALLLVTMVLFPRDDK